MIFGKLIETEPEKLIKMKNKPRNGFGCNSIPHRLQVIGIIGMSFFSLRKTKENEHMFGCFN